MSETLDSSASKLHSSVVLLLSHSIVSEKGLAHWTSCPTTVSSASSCSPWSQQWLHSQLASCDSFFHLLPSLQTGCQQVELALRTQLSLGSPWLTEGGCSQCWPELGAVWLPLRHSAGGSLCEDFHQQQTAPGTQDSPSARNWLLSDAIIVLVWWSTLTTQLYNWTGSSASPSVVYTGGGWGRQERHHRIAGFGVWLHAQTRIWTFPATAVERARDTSIHPEEHYSHVFGACTFRASTCAHAVFSVLTSLLLRGSFSPLLIVKPHYVEVFKWPLLWIFTSHIIL